MFSGLSRNRPQAPGRSRWPVEANDKHSVLQSIVECAVFIYLFGRVAREKPFVKLRPAYSLKLFFSYVVKRIKVKKKITAKFRALRRLRFEDTKRIMSPEMVPKSFGTSEKRAPGTSCYMWHKGSKTDTSKEHVKFCTGYYSYT